MNRLCASLVCAVLLLGLCATAFATTTTFPDVPKWQWAWRYVEGAHDAGVVNGYWDGYHPSEAVNRAQMAGYIARTLAGGDAAIPSGPATATFTDVPTSYWAFKYIEYCHDQGVVNGYWDGYHPEETVTRDQMAVYICRAFNLPIPPQPYNATDYFPMAQNQTWFHLGPGSPGSLTSQVATGTAIISGQTYTALVSYPDGATDYWQTAPDGLRTAGFHDPTVPADILFSPPLLIPNGLDPGDSVTQTAAITINSVPSGEASFTYTLLGTETVTVPAGIFQDCVKSEVLISTPQGTKHFYQWNAKNVGPVQYDSQPFGGTDSWALAGYTAPSSNPPGPPYNITDHFPLGQGDTWTYLASWGSVTQTISGTTTLLSQVYSNMVYPDDYTDYFRNGTDGLYVGGNQDQGQVAVFSPALLFPNDLTPGQTRTDSTTVYVDSVPQGTATVHVTLVGLDDVTVPAGTFAQCLKIELEFIPPGGLEGNGSHSYWWVGPGLGQAIEDKTPFGDTQCSLLSSATVGGVPYPVSVHAESKH